MRIELDEFHKLMKLLQEERQTLIETCQPGFIFTKLLRNDAFSFVSFSRHVCVVCLKFHEFNSLNSLLRNQNTTQEGKIQLSQFYFINLG